MTTVVVPSRLVFRDESDSEVVYLSDIAMIVALHLENMAERYPTEIFGAVGATYDGVAGTALRVVLTQEAKRLRGEDE